MKTNISIRKKDKGYQAIVSYKQGAKWKQKSKQGFLKSSDAKKWAKRTEIELIEDDDSGIVNDSDITVKKLIEMFLAYKEVYARESTVNTHRVNLRRLERLYDHRVKDVNPYEFTTFINELRESTGKNYNCIINSAKQLFSFAIKELRIIKLNPVTAPKIKRSNTRIKYINKELYQEILDSAPNKHYKIITEILYNTGLRYGECLGLEIKNISPTKILVEHQLNRRNELSPLKTENSKREIPITIDLYNDIMSYYNSNPILIDGRIFNYHAVNQHFNKFNTHPHAFRDTYATNLVANGINIKVASEIMGHTLETFLKTYVKHSDEETEKAFEIIRQKIVKKNY